MSSKFVIDEAVFRTVQMGIAQGLANIGFYIEGEAKAITPVHGDGTQGGQFRTRVPGEKPIGGTLRRSIHTVVLLAGQRLFGTGGADENGNSVPSYSAGSSIMCAVGTNIEYAAFVHDGTVKMTGRPFLTVAFEKSRSVWERLFIAGFRQHVR